MPGSWRQTAKWDSHERVRRLAPIPRPLLFLAACTLGLLSPSLRADSWMAPETRIYASPNGRYLLQTQPQNNDPDCKPDPQKNCAATLFRKSDYPPSEFRPIWTGKLVNPVSPVSALVSDDGKFFVTFDDWFGRGKGDNVVVIYDEHGKVIRHFSLPALLPAGVRLEDIPRSISSYEWAGRHRLEKDLLHLELWKSGHPASSKNPPTYRSVIIRLTDGEILPAGAP